MTSRSVGCTDRRERIGVKPEWRERLDRAKAAWEQRDEEPDIKIPDPSHPDPTPHFFTPHDSFELSIYGQVIHDDYDKELRWRRLDPFSQAFVRQMGYAYMMLLVELVAEMRRLITHGLEKDLVDE